MISTTVNLTLRLITAFFCLGFAVAVQASCTKTLVFADPDWQNKNSPSQQANLYQQNQFLTEQVFALAGCKFTLKPTPVKRIQTAIKEGRIDGISGALYSEERTEYSWYTVPYMTEVVTLFMRTANIKGFNPKSLPDLFLDNRRLVLTFGAWYGPELDALLDNQPHLEEQILYTNNFDHKLQFLLNNRADIAVSELGLGLHLLKEQGLQGKVSRHPFIFLEDKVHIILSKKSVSKQDVDTLNQAIREFLETDTYRKVITDYRTGLGDHQHQ